MSKIGPRVWPLPWENTIRFLGEKCLKNALSKNVFQTKVVTNNNTQLLVQKHFWSPNGCGLCPVITIRFFGEKCLKNTLYKICLPNKVVTNQYSQLLCYATFFDILHHYGVIAASQICSVSRKYCILRNRFLYFLDYMKYKVLHWSKKLISRFWWK